MRRRVKTALSKNLRSLDRKLLLVLVNFSENDCITWMRNEQQLLAIHVHRLYQVSFPFLVKFNIICTFTSHDNHLTSRSSVYGAADGLLSASLQTTQISQLPRHISLRLNQFENIPLKHSRLADDLLAPFRRSHLLDLLRRHLRRRARPLVQSEIAG